MSEKTMISRLGYLAELDRHRISKDLIKIVTGVRRCGKSTLLKLYQNKLREEGIKNEQILAINLEDYANKSFLDGEKLHKYVEEQAKKKKHFYVFLDEVQLVSEFSEVINSLRLKDNIDLYVTGSNSSLLSGKLPKILGGRYIQIHMLPLSFKEYTSGFSKQEKNHIDSIFQQYLEFGSFPETLVYRKNMDKQGMLEYLSHIYESIIVRDVMQNDNVKELPQLTRVINFLFSNIGSETSINNMLGIINNEFKLRSSDKNLYAPILEKYINALLDCFIFYKADRQHIKGKELLRTNSKYYAVDAALRYYLLGGSTEKDAGHLLENVVFLELLRRGYKIKIGKIDGKEIDFVAQKSGGKIEYYQVAQSIIDEKTLLRELEPLQAIKDNHPKYLLTRDYDGSNYKGIQHINVLEWLLK